MGTATKGFGTLLKREITPASATYVTIFGATDIPWPSINTDTAETTDMEATSAFRTNVTTLGNLGPISFTLMYDSADATHEQMAADAVAQTMRLYKIIGTDTGAADWAFNAAVTQFEPSSPRDDVHTVAVTLTPTGVVTRT